MTRSTVSRLGRVAVLTGFSVLAVLGTTTAAYAGPPSFFVLSPGTVGCTAQQASDQVRADGSASGQGARFKLIRNGAVVTETPGMVNTWVYEARSDTFPGPGTYVACATNTGTTLIRVTLQIRSDGEF